MSKYKKIFSGLGLLSISTLIGVSVVACAKTKVEKEETPIYPQELVNQKI
ncbi:hypothetical protein ONA23_02130 [Mycoplasmopsis cynos]|nr:hypothetical protein [Mycoplasmopsis cynos]WAM06977.1 hypothetical protein ONA23_02130 [Mycoplasmopsis cynos]